MTEQLTQQFKFIRVRGDDIVAETVTGHRRFFSKKRYNLVIADGIVTVHFTPEQIAARDEESIKPRAEKKLRRCMGPCRTMFYAEKNQYVCAPCKQSPEWRQNQASAGWSH